MSLEELGATLPAPGSSHGRFYLESIDTLDEFQSYGLLYRERISGAEIYHVINEDEENLFSFNFKTIPESGNGVAHILEHSVLCGSERYPVKDPFVMLLKGSMNTFLNAMTYPDKTVYPGASTVKQDLFNLMSVYADAVFFPLLKEEHFRQEGHRLEKNSDGKAEIAGVVYNEMKANYSTHDDIAFEKVIRSVFPDNHYIHDSGGDPAQIPNLKYSEFRNFHRNFYHPSNCRIFLYGNIASNEYLDFLDEHVFSRFDEDFLAKRSSIELPLQPKWSKPRVMETSYPSADEQGEGSSVNLSWLMPDISNRLEVLAWELLSDVLLGNTASPIQKLINQSPLGEDMSSTTGYISEFRQGVFSIGMRGTKPEHAEEVEKLILDGLAAVVRDGINSDLLEGSIRRFEFRSREIKGGGPFGLRLMGRSLRAWLHGASPRTSMDFSPVLSELKAKIEADQQYLTELIRSGLLENTHRSRVTVSPDALQNSRDEQGEQASVDAKMDTLGEDAETILESWTANFADFQAEEDRPEDIATLPFLSADDIPRTVRSIPGDKTSLNSGNSLYFHDVFTNGISYIDLGFDLKGMEIQDLLFLPFFTHLLPQLGSKKYSYEQMMLKWGLITGGFSAYTENSTSVDGENLRYCYLRMKTLDHMSGEGLELMSEVISRPDYSDRAYLLEIFNEYRNDIRSSVIPGGTGFAQIRANRKLNPQAIIDDAWRGAIQLRFVEELNSWAEKNRDEFLDYLSSKLEELSQRLFNPERMILNITAGGDQIESLKMQLESFSRGLSGASGEPGQVGDFEKHMPLTSALLKLEPAQMEGLELSSKVNFTAMALRGSHFNSREQVAEQILAHSLRTGLLWEKIRMEGGAYGAGASPDPMSGLFTFGSYRDPNIERSWDVYKEALNIISGNGIDAHELELAKISIAGRELKPLSPAEQGILGFKRSKYGIKDELRQKRRNWLIELTPEDISLAAKRLAAAGTEASYAVLADPSTVEELASRHPDLQRTPLS